MSGRFPEPTGIITNTMVVPDTQGAACWMRNGPGALGRTVSAAHPDRTGCGVRWCLPGVVRVRKGTAAPFSRSGGRTRQAYWYVNSEWERHPPADTTRTPLP